MSTKKERAAEAAFTFKSILVALPGEGGQKRYGTTFPLDEVEALHVDTEWVNNRFRRQDWEATVVVGLFFLEGDQPLLVARDDATFTVSSGQEVFRHEARFSPADLGDFTFRAGIYRVQVMLNGLAGLSGEIRLVEAPREEPLPRPDVEETLAALYRLVGLREVKEEITRLRGLLEFVRMRRENGFNDEYPVANMLFAGNPGTGKRTVAGLVGELFHCLGILDNGKLHRYRRADLTRPGAAVEEQLTREAIARCAGGVLLLDEVEELLPPADPADPSARVLPALLTIIENERPPLLVILAGEAGAIQELPDAFPAIPALFPVRLAFADYGVDELMEISLQMLERRQFRFAPGAEKAYRALLEGLSAGREGAPANGHLAAGQLDEITSRVARRLMTGAAGTAHTREEMMLVQPGDVPARDKRAPGEDAGRFDRVIVSGELRNNLKNYVNYIYFLRERQRHGFVEAPPPLNAIFAGNPGTGKLTVAKMLGEVLASAGVLARPGVLVKERGELVGDGSYPPQQFALYASEQARGGILYIRDTRQLLQDAPGLAALGAVLGKISGEDRGEMLVILGGDAASMEGLLASNPALRQLFPYFFHFEDYQPDDLLRIALQKIKEREYALHPGAREELSRLIRQACDAGNYRHGNALFIEKIVEQAIRNLSRRVMESRATRELTRVEVTTLRAADIPATLADFPGIARDAFDEKEIAAALEELDRMVGQQKLKKQVRDFVNLARHYHRQGTRLTTRLSLQWCFTGNSGMGKGTVARVIARVYKAMGLIDNLHVGRFKAEKLIGFSEEEIGQQVGNALARAKGGIFFFDEDSPRLNSVRGFKERVRAILMHQMAEKPGSYTVIYADQDPPRHLLTEDVEQVSDMINILPFEDYTSAELMEILKRYLASEGHKMTRRAQQGVASFIEQLAANKHRNRASARLIKLVGEMMMHNCIRRLTEKGKIQAEKHPLSVTLEDVAMFTPDFLNGMAHDPKPIGF
ncbi:MAG: AAA family ATPase [Odoribacteraceae bacterium]|jgi:replication-associated recombination protein RarA|nr:AAA family ATPase [Odoribacteraceae bacterium]